MVFTDIKAAVELGREGVKLLRNAMKRVSKDDPVYSDLEKAHDIIEKMNDAIWDLKTGELELFEKIQNRQETIDEMNVEIKELKEQLNDSNAWLEIENHHIRKLISDGVAVMIPDTQENDPTAPWFCENCFHNRKLSIFVYLGHTKRTTHRKYGCKTCGVETEIRTDAHLTRR